MRTIKPLCLGVMTRPVIEGPEMSLIVTAYAGIDLSSEILSEQKLWASLQKNLPTGCIPDLGFCKFKSEYLVFGRAYPPNENTSYFNTGVRLVRDDKILNSKMLSVFGDRTWIKKSGVFEPSTPELISKPIPLDWTCSFGGEGHSQNPLGVGYSKNTSELSKLPNLDYPDQPFLDPTQLPMPAGFSVLPLTATGRFSDFGTFDDDGLRSDKTQLPKNASPGLFMCAPKDQWFDGPVEPGDQVFCYGMHESRTEMSWSIPDFSPRCFVRYVSQVSSLNPIKMMPDTLLLIPDDGVLGIVWRGRIPIKTKDASDIALLVAGLDDLSHPRTEIHYHHAVKNREGSSQSVLMASLDETDLLPVGMNGSLIPAIPQEIVAQFEKNEADSRRLQASHVSSKAADSPSVAESTPNKETGKVAQQLAAEISNLLLSPQPDTNKLADLVAKAAKLSKESRDKALSDLARLKQSQSEKGGSEETNHSSASGPPFRHLSVLDGRITEAMANGQISSDGHTSFKLKFDQLLEASNEKYRKEAHFSPAATALMDPSKLGAYVSDYVSSKKNVSHRNSDWVGADLSGRSLDGISFAGAFLDGANFSNCSLKGANFNDATLSHAVFDNADLTSARLEGANLGGSSLRGAILTQAHCKRAVFDNALLEGADLKGAVLADCSFIGTVWGDANISGAQLDRSKLLGIRLDTEQNDFEISSSDLPQNVDERLVPMELSHVCAEAAHLPGAILLSCRADRMNLRSADFSRASLLKSRFDHANLTSAKFYCSSVVLDTQMNYAALDSSKITRTTMRGISLRGATFINSKIDNSELSESDFTDSNFQKASVKGTFMKRSKLVNADFSGAKLIGSVFQSSDIKGCLFDYADLRFSDFSNSVYDSETSFEEASKARAQLPDSSDGS